MSGGRRDAGTSAIRRNVVGPSIVRQMLKMNAKAPSALSTPPVARTGTLRSPTCGAMKNPTTINASPTFENHQWPPASLLL